MYPTLSDGDYVLLIYPRLNALKSGDIVVLDHPELGLIIKRIGDIKDRHFAMYGDNHHASTSREQLGYQSLNTIVGKVIWHSSQPAS